MREKEDTMRRLLIVTTMVAVSIASPALAQLVGQPSAQGGAAPPPPNVSTSGPIVPNTAPTTQSQDLLSVPQFEGSSSEAQGSGGRYTPSARVRALNQLTRPALSGDRGQAAHPEGP